MIVGKSYDVFPWHSAEHENRIFPDIKILPLFTLHLCQFPYLISTPGFLEDQMAEMEASSPDTFYSHGSNPDSIGLCNTEAGCPG